MAIPNDLGVLEPLYPVDRPDLPDSLVPKIGPGGEEPVQNPLAKLSFESLVEQEVVSMVKSRKEASKQWRSGKKQIWDKCWEHLKQVYDATGKEDWQSRIFYPDTVKVVEIITANMHSAVLGPDMPIEWQCKVKEFEDEIQATNDIIRNDFGKSSFKMHFTDFLRGIVHLGTSVGKVGYALEEDIVMCKERQKASMAERAIAAAFGRKVQPKPDLYYPKKMLVRDWATIEFRDLYKIYPEPYTTEISKKHWIIEESQITNRELVELANHPDEFLRLKNVTPELLDRGGQKDANEDTETQQRRWALQQYSTAMFYTDPDKPHILDEFWGPVPVWMVMPEKKDDESSKYSMVNAWIWVIDGQHVVRCTLNPYRDGEPPYFKGTYLRLPTEWYGIGAAEMMLNLQIAKNEAINTKSDNVNLLLNMVLAVLKDKVPSGTWDRLVSAPGKLWLFEQTDDIRKVVMPVQFPNLIRDIYMTINEIDRAIQEVTGANSATAGVGGGADEATGGTFRGQLMNRQAASDRWLMYARVLESSGLSDAYRKFYHRIYQYKSYESVENIIGKERATNFEFLVPEKMDQVANLVPLGVTSLESKGIKLAQMNQYGQQWQGRPWLKEYDLARKQWVEMGYTDPDTVIFSPEEMKQYNDFRRQAMAQLGATPGAPQLGAAEPGDGANGMGENGANAPQAAQPIAGNVPAPSEGMPSPASPARGPGASPMDMSGMPMS